MDSRFGNNTRVSGASDNIDGLKKSDWCCILGSGGGGGAFSNKQGALGRKVNVEFKL